MFRNFDTKGNNYFHPYNTRSRRGTVVKEEHTSAEFGPANVIPSTLHNAIQAALGAWKDWEAKKDKQSEEALKSKEHVVEALTTYYKQEKLLPASWTCEPATASTLVPSNNKEDSPLGGIYLGSPKVCEHDSDSVSDSDSDVHSGIDSDSDVFHSHRTRDLPPINSVPLEKHETESWMQFKKLDESNRARVKVSPDLIHALIPVDIRHPFVKLIGNFAVTGFNKSYEKYIDKGKCSQLHDSVLRKFAYRKLRDITCYNVKGEWCKLGGPYLFYMLIDAVEDGIRGIYRAKVRCTCDGVKTLLTFSYVDRTKTEKKLRKNKEFKVLGAVEQVQNNRGFNLLQDEENTRNREMEMRPTSTNEVYIRSPLDSGMELRMGSTSGYDFYNVCNLICMM